jgi:hypothetical protein
MDTNPFGFSYCYCWSCCKKSFLYTVVISLDRPSEQSVHSARMTIGSCLSCLVRFCLQDKLVDKTLQSLFLNELAAEETYNRESQNSESQNSESKNL